MAEPFLPEKYLTAPENTVTLTCKIALPNSPHAIIFSKNLGFQALHLARWNEFHFLFNNKKMFHSGCWLLPKKFSICPKNNGLARLREAAAPWLIRLQ